MDWSPILISMRTAGLSIVFTFFMGILAAWMVVRISHPLVKTILDGIFTIPLVLPPTVAGFFLLYVFGVKRPVGQFFLEYFSVKIAFSWGATVLAAVVMSFPLMYRSARGAFEQVDDTLVQAARTLGMGEWTIFRKVLLANAVPGVVSGGVLAHANGITLSQPLNDTVVLVKAPGAGGVKVENQTGVRTDWRGYAVLPYATEYRENRIALDTNTLADNVDLDDAVVSVVPTHGAIVRANFNAQVGMKILMTLTHRGKPVPFGALATGDSNQSGSIVADNGQVYLSGMPLAGKVRVKWGDGPDAQCVADYRLPPESQQQALSQLSVACR